jgi:hypothetical protein
MDDHEFDIIVHAQQRAISQKLENPDHVELLCQETDDGRILGILRPAPGGRTRKTFLVSGRDEDGDIEHQWAEDFATDLFSRWREIRNR